nr:uncharacterized protein LOC109164504 [Ipomoea batatas]
MEGCNKRARDESELDSVSPEPKRVDTKADPRVNSSDSERFNSEGPHSGESDRVEVDSAANSDEFNLDSPVAMQFRDDILEILDEPDALTERDPVIQDLDLVIKSFEEEILHPAPAEQTVVDLASSHSGESQPDLGFLLEASDDELGLPPTVPSPEKQGTNDDVADLPAGAAVLDNLMGFEGELTSYDSFDLGIDGITEGDNYGGNNGAEFVTVDGLFDYSEPSDFAEFSWRPESLPAV